MRESRSSRKTNTENRENCNRNVAFSDMHDSQQSVWAVNGDGHPKSPLSIERMQRHLKRKVSKVARVKPIGTEMVREEYGEPDELFPFFIDKSPSKEMVNLRKRGRSFINDSVIVLDSPSVSTTARDLTLNNRRQDSVDTVDLCSDEEEDKVSVKATKRRRKRRQETPGKKRKLCSKAKDDHQPDVIVLDDDDDESAASKSSNNNASIIIESVHKIGPDNTQHSDNSSAIMVVPPTGETPSTSIISTDSSNDRHTNIRSKYLDRASAAKIPHDKDVMLSGNTNPGPSCAGSNATKPDIPDTVGSNVFIPHPVEQTGLRPIVIDGCNVAIGHGGNRIFSVKGLCICVEYFVRRGHTQVLVVVPLHQRSKVSPMDRDILESLRDDGHLVFTPSRFIGNQLISSYDDRYIVQYAAAVGGVIVSRDNFRDLLSENPTWRETITQRLLIPTWVGDMLMFPMDPLGRRGPSLDEFLSFPHK